MMGALLWNATTLLWLCLLFIYSFIYLFFVVDFISPQVALVMTDGKQTVRNDSILSSNILSAAVQPLKDRNIKVISLGIGKNTNLFHLMTIASSSDDVYLAENFAVLKGLVATLTQNKCPGRLVTYFQICFESQSFQITLRPVQDV